MRIYRINLTLLALFKICVFWDAVRRLLWNFQCIYLVRCMFLELFNGIWKLKEVLRSHVRWPQVLFSWWYLPSTKVYPWVAMIGIFCWSRLNFFFWQMHLKQFSTISLHFKNRLLAYETEIYFNATLKKLCEHLVASYPRVVNLI